MQSTTRVALDAMGGDNAPAEVVKGAVDAVNKRNDIKIFLVGQKVPVERELSLYTYPKEQIEIVDAPEVIEMAEPPVGAIRRKKQSSIVVGMNMVKNKEADAFVSAGSSGAVLVGGQVIVGRIKGIQRPPLAPLIPTERGVSLLIDCGANVDARAEHLVQFAKMGSIYMEHVVGVKNPKVALVNIGAEEEKGNALVKETMPLLRECTDINFVGSIEARDIPKGDADVIVCEAFTGNVILKLYEGLSSTLIGVIKKGLMSTLKSKIGAALALPALKNTLKSFDATEYGGAPLLGLNGLVVKTHGSSKAKEITNSVFQCVTFKEKEINDKIKEYIIQNIEDEKYNENEQIESEHALCELFGVTRMTVRQALTELINENIIYSVPKVGSFVCKKSRFKSFDGLNSVTEDCAKKKEDCTSHVVLNELEEATDLMKKEMALEDNKVWHVKRVRLVNGEPLCFEDDYCNYDLTGDIPLEVSSTSLFNHFENDLNLHIAFSDQQIDAVLACEELGKYLQVDPMTPLLRVLSITCLHNGKCIEYGYTYYRVDKYTFNQVAYRRK